MGRRVREAKRPAHIGIGFQNLPEVGDLGFADVYLTQPFLNGLTKLEKPLAIFRSFMFLGLQLRHHLVVRGDTCV